VLVAARSECIHNRALDRVQRLRRDGLVNRTQRGSHKDRHWLPVADVDLRTCTKCLCGRVERNVQRVSRRKQWRERSQLSLNLRIEFLRKNRTVPGEHAVIAAQCEPATHVHSKLAVESA